MSNPQYQRQRGAKKIKVKTYHDYIKEYNERNTGKEPAVLPYDRKKG